MRRGVIAGPPVGGAEIAPCMEDPSHDATGRICRPDVDRLWFGSVSEKAANGLYRLWLDQGQHAFDHRFDAGTSGVDADGVVGRPQWRHRA